MILFLRFILKKTGWIKFSTEKVIALFIVSVLITGLLAYYGSKTTAVFTGNSLVEYEKNENLKQAISKEKALGLSGTSYYLATQNNPRDSLKYSSAQNIKKTTGWYRNTSGIWKYEEQHKGRFWWDIIFTFILIALWLLLYMIWHYLERNRKDEVDRLNLEKTVKDLELKTIKSHINPHFIFNSLNSIRALVEENPKRARTAITELSNILRSSLQVEKMETVPLQKELDIVKENPKRARTAITELSNILRSSLQVEKMETVPLQKELDIVKDYLALEQMRFEERLKVQFDIDEDTLGQQVPPMMLQTLVENAIKHGISKRINGGTIKIISRFTVKDFELIVENSGNLEKKSGEGFGFKSTRDRLKFLCNGNAYFKVEEIEGTKVQSKIVMPVEW